MRLVERSLMCLAHSEVPGHVLGPGRAVNKLRRCPEPERRGINKDDRRCQPQGEQKDQEFLIAEWNIG